MEILFASKKLEKQLTNPRLCKKVYGKLSENILMRLSELIVAETLDEISPNPPPRRHKMSGEVGVWSVDVSKNQRMWLHSVNGEDDPLRITTVEILDIFDDH